MWSRNLDHRWRKGTVLFVTARGGIRVRTKSGEEWVPYHYLLRKVTGKCHPRPGDELKQTPTAWPTDPGCDSIFALIRGGVAWRANLH